MTRVGLFGGAFDPPHIGHLVVAAEARWQLELDEVRLCPVGRPAHRAAPVADADERLALARAAADGHAGLSVTDIETARPGPSFTVDTLRLLAEREPGVEWTIIIGADQVNALDSWRAPDEIVTLARLGIVARGDADEADVSASAERHAAGRWALVQIPRIDVSSTLVRERIASGRPYHHLVPTPVWRRIEAHGLYRGTRP